MGQKNNGSIFGGITCSFAPYMIKIYKENIIEYPIMDFLIKKVMKQNFCLEYNIKEKRIKEWE